MKKIAQPPTPAITYAPKEVCSDNFDFDLHVLDRGYSGQTDFSSSGALFQVDIEQELIFDEQHYEKIPETDAFSNLKDFFELTLSNGVDSLSCFLTNEFERLLDKRDNLILGPTYEGKAIVTDTVLEKTDHQQPKVPEFGCLGALSDAFVWDGYCGDSCCSCSGDEYLGHVSENEKRVPISTLDDLWDSDANEDICVKALRVTQDNYLPTQTLNTQKRMFRKKNQRSHLMKTRSQSRIGL
ncbi:unnamed protein product [Cuscuta epithymum]|nr:unnamed protein product [Cuscuta epithymum]